MINATAELKILKINPGCTVQDMGRVGFKRFGVSESGAADKFSYGIANKILGNKIDAPALEIIFGNSRCVFEKATRICITGADTQAKINQCEVPRWTSLDVNAGDTLELGFPKAGIYNYIALKEGLHIDKVLGSAAESPRDAIGPHQGQTIKPDQIFLYLPSEKKDARTVTFSQKEIPNYQDPLELRFLPVKHFKDFSEADKNTLLNSDYKIQTDSNKMGARLTGSSLTYQGKALMSQAVSAGTIQIPPSGMPLVLLADHQTIGGYPVLGQVYLSDTFALAQRRPGQRVRFSIGSLEAAQASLKKLKTALSSAR